jgi:hypothetical protein
MPLSDRCSLDRELLKTRLQRHEDGAMITDDRLRRSPLLNGLAEDLDHAGEGLPVEARGSDDRPAVPIEDEDAIEPLVVAPRFRSTAFLWRLRATKTLLR